jgi:hypothetical protein
MHLQIKPTKWSCTPTAFAMAMDVLVTDLIDWIGHDGSEIISPSWPEPQCRRGFHPQECIRWAIKQGLTVTPIEVFPSIRTDSIPFVINYGDNWDEFDNCIKSSRGVLTGQGRRCGHAVAFENGQIYDPDGYIYTWDECTQRGYYPQCAWIMK